MDSNWNNFCTMSIVHFMAFPTTMAGDGPIIETVKKLAGDPFFGAIEIGWIKDKKIRTEVKAICQASHLQIGFGGQIPLLMQKLNINSLDEVERKKAIDQLKQSVDEAFEIGAQRLAFLSGKDPGDADRTKAFDLLVDSVNTVCAYAQEKGIGLTLETFDRSIDKKCLIGPSELAAKFATIIREKYADFGLLYDLSHMPLLSETPENSLKVLKDYLVHIHVGNGVVDPALPGYGDLHPRFGWPGGCNDVPELAAFLKMLLEIGYLDKNKTVKPWVGFEVKPQNESETSELIIAGTKRAWQAAWALV
jgi:sugar phosphate isomerase/epimerase